MKKPFVYGELAEDENFIDRIEDRQQLKTIKSITMKRRSEVAGKATISGIRTIYTQDKQTEELLPDGFFDLSGRRLSAPQRGKINIINGKKLLVR